MRYIDVAHQYRANGWNPLPLTPRSKSPVPTGYTGHDGKAVTEADIDGWAETWPHWNRERKVVEQLPSENVGLRMPATVIGIDVDDYGTKNGHTNRGIL